MGSKLIFALKLSRTRKINENSLKSTTRLSRPLAEKNINYGLKKDPSDLRIRSDRHFMWPITTVIQFQNVTNNARKKL